MATKRRRLKTKNKKKKNKTRKVIGGFNKLSDNVTKVGKFYNWNNDNKSKVVQIVALVKDLMSKEDDYYYILKLKNVKNIQYNVYIREFLDTSVPSVAKPPIFGFLTDTPDLDAIEVPEQQQRQLFLDLLDNNKTKIVEIYDTLSEYKASILKMYSTTGLSGALESDDEDEDEEDDEEEKQTDLSVVQPPAADLSVVQPPVADPSVVQPSAELDQPTSTDEDAETRVDKSKEYESTSKTQLYIANVAREVSLVARKAADALAAMKVDVKKEDLSGDQEILEATSETEEEEEVREELEVSEDTSEVTKADEIKRLTERNIELLKECNKIIGENFEPMVGGGPKSAFKSNTTKKSVTITKVDESKQKGRINEILVIIKKYLPATVLDDEAIKSINELLSSDLNTPLTEDIKVEIGYIKQIIEKSEEHNANSLEIIQLQKAIGEDTPQQGEEVLIPDPDATSDVKEDPVKRIMELTNAFNELVVDMKDATTMDQFNEISAKGRRFRELKLNNMRRLYAKMYKTPEGPLKDKLRIAYADIGSSNDASIKAFDEAKKQKEAELKSLVGDDDELSRKLEEGIKKQKEEEKKLEKGLDEMVHKSDIEALGVAAGNVADAVREVAKSMKDMHLTQNPAYVGNKSKVDELIERFETLNSKPKGNDNVELNKILDEIYKLAGDDVKDTTLESLKKIKSLVPKHTLNYSLITPNPQGPLVDPILKKFTPSLSPEDKKNATTNLKIKSADHRIDELMLQLKQPQPIPLSNAAISSIGQAARNVANATIGVVHNLRKDLFNKYTQPDSKIESHLDVVLKALHSTYKKKPTELYVIGTQLYLYKKLCKNTEISSFIPGVRDDDHPERYANYVNIHDTTSYNKYKMHGILGNSTYKIDDRGYYESLFDDLKLLESDNLTELLDKIILDYVEYNEPKIEVAYSAKVIKDDFNRRETEYKANKDWTDKDKLDLILDELQERLHIMEDCTGTVDACRPILAEHYKHVGYGDLNANLNNYTQEKETLIKKQVEIEEKTKAKREKAEKEKLAKEEAEKEKAEKKKATSATTLGSKYLPSAANTIASAAIRKVTNLNVFNGGIYGKDKLKKTYLKEKKLTKKFDDKMRFLETSILDLSEVGDFDESSYIAYLKLQKLYKILHTENNYVLHKYFDDAGQTPTFGDFGPEFITNYFKVKVAKYRLGSETRTICAIDTLIDKLLSEPQVDNELLINRLHCYKVFCLDKTSRSVARPYEDKCKDKAIYKKTRSTLSFTEQLKEKESLYKVEVDFILNNYNKCKSLASTLPKKDAMPATDAQSKVEPLQSADGSEVSSTAPLQPADGSKVEPLQPTDQSADPSAVSSEVSSAVPLKPADLSAVPIKPLLQNKTKKNQPQSRFNMTFKSKPVVVQPKFDTSIKSNLPISYNNSKITTTPELIIITINKTGVFINGKLIDDKDKWNAARQMYLGYENSPDDFELPRYTAGELKFIIDLNEQKMAAYINGGKERLINNSQQLDEFKAELNR